MLMISSPRIRIHSPCGELLESLDNTRQARQVIYDLYILPDRSSTLDQRRWEIQGDGAKSLSSTERKWPRYRTKVGHAIFVT